MSYVTNNTRLWGDYMNITGLILKQIRTNKGISLQDAAKDIVTSSYLSKVEHGDNEISFSKMLLLLNRLNVSMSEYMTEYETHIPDFETTINHALNAAYESLNVEQLKIIQNKIMHEWNQAKSANIYNQYIIAKVFIADLSDKDLAPQDITYIQNYLFNIEQWSRYEYWFFSTTLILLPENVILALASDLLLKSDFSSKNIQNLETYTGLLLNIAIKGIHNNNFQLIKLILPTAKKNAFANTNLQHRLIAAYIEGIYLLHQGFLDQGHEQVAKTLATMRFLQEPVLADRFKKIYQYFLEQN